MEPIIKVQAVNQVAVVVKDLQKSMETYWNVFGIGPWQVYTFEPSWIKGMTYKGERSDYAMKLALTMVGPVMYELIQPLWGDNVYSDFLREHGEGLHHLGFFVEDMDKDAEKLKAAGINVIQSGRGFGVNGDGGYTYLGTQSDCGAIMELIEMAEVRTPEAVYPPQPEGTQLPI